MRKVFICTGLLIILALLAWAAGPTTQIGILVLGSETITPAGTGALSVPAPTGGADTFTYNSTTATLLRKTFDTAGAGNVFKVNTQQISAFRGNTAIMQLENGATVSGNFVKFDANGNTADSGISSSGTLAKIYNTTWAKSDTGSVASPAAAPTTKTLAQADLVANAEWLLEADVAVQDVGGGSPTLSAALRLGGVSLCSFGCVGSACNNAIVTGHIRARIKVLTTGAGGTAKAQCFTATATPGVGQVGVLPVSNGADTTFAIDTTGAVTVDWLCSDSLNNLHCLYYDNLFWKVN